ncbi:glycosyltransferase family 2 protein [Saprospiraceae bacterium]|nr:glycosyltransferase family 2 protein [Saprospiraceae bacterium]
MISFLIPIYNQDVNTLIDCLFEQCRATGEVYEIICYDDYSDEKYKILNRALSEKMGVSYMEMSKNLGRSKIRNWLGKNARYEQLVFMDCDSVIEHDGFVQQYINSIGKADLVYGGTSYQSEKPDDNKLLHWKYGKKVEALSVGKRTKQGFRSFRSNNFMITRSVFVKNLFDEKVEGYGYEDNLLSESLQEQNLTILHIDNPLLHDGLEKNNVFISKTENAISNLVKKYAAGQIKTRLTDLYERLDDIGLTILFKKYTTLFAKNRRAKLIANKAPLLSFQLYKLELFIDKLEASDSE